METVYKWADIEADYEDGLILGNGASIAFDPRFYYHSLKEKAQELDLITADVQRVFEDLHTNDFELVLRMLWHASKINLALEIPDDRTTQAYASVRDALIETVYDEVLPQLGESIVLFGWSIDENDVHLLDAVCKGNPRRFAVAVHPLAANRAVFESMVRHKLGERLGQGCFDLTFFDRASAGCWISS